MKTIRMALTDDLLREIDTIVKETHSNRSAFICDALQKALQYYHERQLSEQQRKGYLLHPVEKDEFSVWENEQAWIKQ